MTDTAEDLKAKLAEIKGARAKLAKDAEPTEEDLLRAEIEREELALANDKMIASAVSEYGELGVMIATVDTSAGVVIVKRPNALLFRKFQDEGKFTTAAFHKLVSPCVVCPSPDRFEQVINELPAVLSRCADAVATLAGAKAQEQEGKS